MSSLVTALAPCLALALAQPAEAPPTPFVDAPPAAAPATAPVAAPEPPATPAAPPESPAPPSGQWAYTQQYGWLWMPYGDAYTSLPPDGDGEPYEYVYYPSLGWTWVVAPWIWGFGPWPFFGIHGPYAFGWYGHGWWRSPWRWHFRPGPFAGGFAFHGVRPAPAHGFSPFAGSHGFHGAFPGGHVGHFGGGPFGGGHGGGGHGGGRR